jgi:hypothetical protein
VTVAAKPLKMQMNKQIRKVSMKIPLSAGKNPFPTLLALALLILPWPAQAFTINLVYDSSVTTLTNAAQVEEAFTVAVQTFQSLYTNPITVNINVYWGNSGFGNSGDSLIGNPSYAELTNALSSGATTAADSNAVASLPASDPIAPDVWWIPRAEAKALTSLSSLFGMDPNDTNNDGAVYFGPNVNWTFDPTNRAVPGAYDFISVAEHEISEVLGRCYALNYNPSGGYVPYDLFRFTNNGARTFNVYDSGVYFSVNNGLTALKYFNAVTNGPITSDVQDWLPGSTPDSFDFARGPDQKAILSFADLTALDVIGYDLNFIPPSLAGVRLTNGNFEISFTNVTGLGFVVWASTNLSLSAGNWTNLGAPTEIAIGQYQFIDTQAPNDHTRFYRVVLQ